MVMAAWRLLGKPLAEVGAAIHMVAHAFRQDYPCSSLPGRYTAAKNQVEPAAGYRARMPWFAGAFTGGALEYDRCATDGRLCLKWYILAGGAPSRSGQPCRAFFASSPAAALERRLFLPIIYMAWFAGRVGVRGSWSSAARWCWRLDRHGPANAFFFFNGPVIESETTGSEAMR